jgi:hypothetical protein
MRTGAEHPDSSWAKFMFKQRMELRDGWYSRFGRF